jgi:hypothetical protein
MTETFTPGTDLTANDTEKEQKNTFSEFAEPSKRVIDTILSFSKNLEVKQSKLVNEVKLLKS